MQPPSPPRQLHPCIRFLFLKNTILTVCLQACFSNRSDTLLCNLLLSGCITDVGPRPYSRLPCHKFFYDCKAALSNVVTTRCELLKLNLNPLKLNKLKIQLYKPRI